MLAPVEHMVIRDVELVDPSLDLRTVADVSITNGRISAIGTARSKKGRQLRGQDCLLLPSLTDLRARLGQPGEEYREDLQSGLKAAARGGYGAVCQLPNTRPVADTGVVLDAMLREASEVGGARLLPLAATTRGLQGEHLAEYGELKACGAVALSDGDGPPPRASVLRRILEYAQTFDMLVMQRPIESSLGRGTLAHEGAVATRLGLRGCPAEAEEIALSQALALVRLTGARFHATALSTRQAVRLVREAKSQGIPVTADVSVHNLTFTDEVLKGFDTNHRLDPPLRSQEHQDALWEGLLDGTIDAVVSDHTPLSQPEKNHEFEVALPGALGLEFTLSLLLAHVRSGRLPLERLVAATSTRPAELLGLRPPRVAVGELANFTLVAPNETWSPARQPLLSKSRNTPLLDTQLDGQVRLTLVDGIIVYDPLA
jgi:dihydroorotase